nr:M48 family metallopeptidase [uncultured Rhodoferax sp.]
MLRNSREAAAIHGTCTGRFFAPGLDGAGVAATGLWQHGRLQVQAADHAWESAADARVQSGGFNAAQLALVWADAAGECRFYVDAGSTRAAFAAGLPVHLAPQHHAAGKANAKVERRFRLGWATLALLGLLPLLALVLLLTRVDDAVGWLVQHIPREQEARLGELVLAQTRAQMRVIESGPAVDAVRLIGQRLTTGSAYTYRWLVVDKPELNAFAAPGGVVVVYSGLLQAAKTPEEAAGVIAHEVAHAELRHGLQGMVKALGVRAGAAVLLGDWSGAVLGQAMSALLDMKFSREAEDAADAEGLRRLVAARIHPAGMADFMDTLARQSPGAAVPELLSTHPATEGQAARLREAAQAHAGPWVRLPLDWVAVQKSLPLDGVEGRAP